MSDGEKPFRVALLALVATGALYLAGAAAFALMLWSLFQILMWVFGG